MAVDTLHRTILTKLNEVAPGDPDNERQAEVIARAVRLARAAPRPLMLSEVEASTPLKAALSLRRSEQFRKGQRLYVNDLMLTDAEVAFGDPPDQFREAHSAFCYALWRGYGARFIDRHQAEDPEEFVDRPGKVVMNLTALVIYILSKLYHRPPTRTIDAEFATAQPNVATALNEMWSDPLFNLTMIEVDRLTRLLGTVAVRPFFDPRRQGKIRLWVFLNHQLRVVPDTERPWEPAAVIERVQPFRRSSVKNIWTNKWFLVMKANMAMEKVEAERHTLGRIPHSFFRDGLSFTSFFADGRGRMLCDPNRHLNDRLTDLHEVEQLQGFSMVEALNPESDDITVGPREAVVFRPQAGGAPFGLNFKSPNAPLDKLRASIEADVRDILRVNRVPEAALGAAIQQRQLSGAAIRAALQPLSDDLEERGRLFSSYELDLADVCMRIRAEHDRGSPITSKMPGGGGAHAGEPGAAAARPDDQTPASDTLPAPVEAPAAPAGGPPPTATTVTMPEAPFSYDGTVLPKFVVRYVPPDVPLDTQEEVKRNEFDIANGVITPADLIHERDPDKFKTRDEAVLKWKANLAEAEAAGFATQDTEKQLGQDPNTPLLNALTEQGEALDALARPLVPMPGA